MAKRIQRISFTGAYNPTNHKIMAIKRKGNRIDITGNDASRIARAILPSMRDTKPTIDHEAEVKKVYPYAYGQFMMSWFLIVDGKNEQCEGGEKIGELARSRAESWESAYKNMVSQGLITPQTTDTNEKAD